MEFLGHVNVFHGRVQDGRAHVWGLEFAAPPASPAGAAQVYVRQHELELHAVPAPESFPAEVRRLVPLGGSVRVELTAASVEGPLAAEVEARRAEALGLKVGDRVYVAPRRVRVFDDPAKDSLTASGL